MVRAGLTTVLLASTAALAAPLGCQQPEAEAAPEGPLFAHLWIGGRVDSLYNAETARLPEACDASDIACFRRELDTTAVVLAQVHEGPDDSRVAGWLVAALRTRDRWPYATLMFRPHGAPDVVVRDNLGDWGYGMTVPLAGTGGDRVGLHFEGRDAPLWIGAEVTESFDVIEVHGLTGRLWRMGPVPARRAADGEAVALDAGEYMVLNVSDGLVRLRHELPSDMACGREVPADPADPPMFDVALSDLVGPDGIPRVHVAYGKGC